MNRRRLERELNEKLSRMEGAVVLSEACYQIRGLFERALDEAEEEIKELRKEVEALTIVVDDRDATIEHLQRGEGM
jgi:predicted nucleic acid-binding protein